MSASVRTAPRVHDTVFPGSPKLTGLVSDAGEPFDALRRRLLPRYGRVWRDIGDLESRNSTSLMKPMSSIRSASSSTTKRNRDRRR